MINDLLSLVLAQVSVDVPKHAARSQPPSLHGFESLIVKVFQQLAQSGLLDFAGVEECVQLSVGQAVHLVQVVVLPLLKQLLLDLVEDLVQVSVLERADFLESLTHEHDQRIIEAAPLQVYVIFRDREAEFELGTVRHIRELS